MQSISLLPEKHFPKEIYINVNKGEILIFKKQIVHNQSPITLSIEPGLANFKFDEGLQ